MKIIAVNISRALGSTSKITVIDATKRAWRLNINKCKDYDYVIGIVNGKIIECFTKPKLGGQNYDFQHPNRVEFVLFPCNAQEDVLIRNYCSTIDLKFITTKYIN